MKTEVMRRSVVCWMAGMAVGLLGPVETSPAQGESPLTRDVVINEIHTNPDVETEAVEFVELYNAGPSAVDLSAWSFADGVSFTFPIGTVLVAGGYLVVAEDPAALAAKWGVQALGPWTGSLANEGDTVILCDTGKRVVDRVDYGLGFPWPTVGDSPGYSMELIHPSLDNDLGGSWRASVAGGGGSTPMPQQVFGLTQPWRYDQSGSDLGTAWRGRSFSDSGWASGGGLLYVESASVSPKGTPLTIGRTTYYFRTRFTFLGDPSRTALQFTAMVDDGAVFYLNGQEFYRLGMPAGEVNYSTFASRTVDNAASEGPFTVAATSLVKGENVLAVEVHQVNAGSSDIVFGMTLATTSSGAAPGGHGPTPGRLNSVWSEDAPPAVRQVSHSPQQPGSNQVVTITAKVTDPNGVSSVSLSYQVVDSGDYIPITLPNYPARAPNQTVPNPDYEAAANWSTLSMHDDGLHGDLTAGDDVYTVQIPVSVQTHRRLVRYRITAEDGLGQAVQVPYADDAGRNFAYFVYDGVPAWRGAINPNGAGPLRQVAVYPEEVMSSLPVYHLLSREVDVENAQYNGSYDNTEYYFSGTLVVDGAVYDNIHYRRRGQYSPGQTGKEKWKFDFNRGRYFQAKDDYGREHRRKWDKMNVGTGTCPWWQYPHPGSWDVGTQGMVMNETLAFRLYNLAGVPSCTTNYFHLRVIDSAVEADPTNQYEGDFWGLYFTIEQADGAFLDEHGLPDGNVYRMDSGYNLTHQGASQPTNGSDVTTFINTYNSRPSPAWWAQNVNLANYYNSKAVGVAINDSDRRPEANCIYYHNSETGQWWMLPWDLDLTFEWGTHYTEWEHFRYALDYPEYGLVYKNRARELLDLLFNGEQAAEVVDEMAAVIATAYGGRTFVEANRALWDYHPRTRKKGQFYENNEFLQTKDWPGQVEYYKAFLTPAGFSNVASGQYGVYALVAEAEDPAIPRTPTIRYTGTPGYPVDDLRFTAGSFSDPQGAGTFGSMRWRIAEVSDGADPITPSAGPRRYEIEPVWESQEIRAYTAGIQIPAGAVAEGRTYRVRCRMKDSTGRWSHWSDPVQFAAGAPLLNKPRLALRVTEIMYHPPVSAFEDGWDQDEFEFIELMNIGSTGMDLSGVRLEGGVGFAFAGSDVTQLAPGACVLVVENPVAFECRYGSSLAPRIAGQYEGKLSNGGERISVVDLNTGQVVAFGYGDAWVPATDGQGHSLVLMDPLHADPDQMGQKASWRASTQWGGSPGTADPE